MYACECVWGCVYVSVCAYLDERVQIISQKREKERKRERKERKEKKRKEKRERCGEE